MKNKIIACIPARLGSTRLKNKMLLKRNGIPLVVHTAKNAETLDLFAHVVVATDSKRIESVCKKHNITVMMTSKKHKSGTDRIVEAMENVAKKIHYDAVVNVQGDMPDIDKTSMKILVDLLEGGSPVATLACPFKTKKEYENPNNVKVILTNECEAIYFSRACIPYNKAGIATSTLKKIVYHHLGVYGYTKNSLERFNTLNFSIYETVEKLEQLRYIENGYPMAVGRTEGHFTEINTKEDYNKWVLS